MVKINNKPKQLTELFYETYSQYCEILLKQKRQYCIAILVVDDIKFAIPFRTNINHKYGYIFKNSSRSNKAGLDFTKAIVIKDEAFIGADTIIDSKEYSEFINKQVVIGNRFRKFIKDYKKWTTNPKYYRAEKIIEFSALKYFHKELGLE